MILKPSLAADSDAEAARIQLLRDRKAATAPLPPGIVPVARVRRAKTSLLHGPALVFFERVRIVDGAGRRVEELLVALKVRLKVQMKASALMQHCEEDVKAAAREQAALRVAEVAAFDQPRVVRSRRREERLRAAAATGAQSLIQGGLFDNRTLIERSRVSRASAAASTATSERIASLDLASSGLSTQSIETVLLLHVERA